MLVRLQTRRLTRRRLILMASEAKLSLLAANSLHVLQRQHSIVLALVAGFRQGHGI